MIMMGFNKLAFCFCVLLGLILISGLSFAETATFDEGNSCFCKSGQGVMQDILCSAEKISFYFFNTTLDCTPESGSEGTSGFSNSGGKGPAESGSSREKSKTKD